MEQKVRQTVETLDEFPGTELAAAHLGAEAFLANEPQLATNGVARAIKQTSIAEREDQIELDNQTLAKEVNAIIDRNTATVGKPQIHRGGVDDLTRLYLEDIGRVELLNKNDERILAQAVERGRKAREDLEQSKETGRIRPAERKELRGVINTGEKATDIFISSNLRLVVSIAKRYQASGLPLVDLVQEGNVGLIHAVEKFDWRKGFKFSTYATWWVRQAIQRGIINNSRNIRLPVHVSEHATLLQKEKSAWYAEHGAHASIDELAERTGMSPDKIRELLPMLEDTVSSNAPIGPEGSESELHFYHADPSADVAFANGESRVMLGDIKDVINRDDTLIEQERAILSLIFGLHDGVERTVTEIAQELSLNEENVKRALKYAIKRLRNEESEFYQRYKEIAKVL